MPRYALHVRIQQAEGLRSLSGEEKLHAFVVAQIHPAGRAPPPALSSIASHTPPAAAHFSTRPCASPNPHFFTDGVLSFQHWEDHISLAVCDANATAGSGGGGGGGGGGSGGRRVVAATLLPLSELQQQHWDRWLDLQVPPVPSSHSKSSSMHSPAALAMQRSNPLAAQCPDINPQDAVLQVLPTAGESEGSVPCQPLTTSATPRLRLQMYVVDSHTSTPLHRLTSFPEERHPLLLHIITWNAGNARLPEDMRALLPAESLRPGGRMPDLIAIGLQECAYEAGGEKDWSGQPLVPSSGPGGASCEASVIAAFTRLLPPCYTRIHAHSLWEMRLLLFCTFSLRPSLSHLTVDSVATGVGNVLANKGGIIASFRVRETHIALITGHLAAHTDRVKQRNKDLALICKSVQFKFDEGEKGTRGQKPSMSSSYVVAPASTDVLSNFHLVALFGDLNYRLEYPAGCVDRSPSPQHFAHIVRLIRESRWEELWELDQLLEQVSQGRILPGFEEGRPDFPPSFKVLRNTGLGYTHKRLPSYCDRVLWRSVFAAPRLLPSVKTEVARPVVLHKDTSSSLPTPSSGVHQHSLQIASALLTSDHKPITSTLVVDTFWKAGRQDHALSTAMMSLHAVTATPSPAVPISSVFPDCVLEIRASFLEEPLVCHWTDRDSHLSLPLPLAFNHPQRLRREIILVRLFKGSRAVGAVGFNAQSVPIAKGVGVLQLEAEQSTEGGGSTSRSGSGSSSSSLRIQSCTLSIPLNQHGALVCTLNAQVRLQWQLLQAASKAGHVRKASQVQAEEAEEHRKKPLASSSKPVLPTLRQKSATRSSLVSLTSPSHAAPSLSASSLSALRSHRRTASKPLDDALSSLQATSSSMLSRLKQDTPRQQAARSHADAIPSATDSPSSHSTHSDSTLTLLLALLAQSEDTYAHVLQHLLQRYYLPLERLAKEFEARQPSSADFASSSPSELLVRLFSNLPLLAPLHHMLAQEMEARLRLANFGCQRSEGAASAFSDQSLLALGELLQQFLPLFSLYRFTLYTLQSSSFTSLMSQISSSSAAHDSKESFGSEASDLFIAAIRKHVAQVERSTRTTFQSLIALPLQRMAAYQLFVAQIQQRLQRLAKSQRATATTAAPSPPLPSLPRLRRLYGSLVRSFDQLQSHLTSFADWYPSLAQQRQQQEEDEFYAQLAGEDQLVSPLQQDLRRSMAYESMRPSSVAMLRPGTAYQPLSTGFRPATSYGQEEEMDAGFLSPLADDLLYSRDGLDTAASISHSDSYLSPAQRLALVERIHAQLSSRAPLPGFHPYTPTGRTQEDRSLEFRRREQSAASSSPFPVPPRARSLSVSALSSFTSASPADAASMVLSPSTRSSPPPHSSPPHHWSLQQVCQSLAIGCSVSGGAAAADHWSLRLPAAFRKRQVGRSIITLLDSRAALLADLAERSSPPALASATMSPPYMHPSSPAARSESTEESYEDDPFEEEATAAADRSLEESVDMSLDSEAMSRLLQATARAHSHAAAKRVHTRPLHPSLSSASAGSVAPSSLAATRPLAAISSRSRSGSSSSGLVRGHPLTLSTSLGSAARSGSPSLANSTDEHALGMHSQLQLLRAKHRSKP